MIKCHSCGTYFTIHTTSMQQFTIQKQYQKSLSLSLSHKKSSSATPSVAVMIEDDISLDNIEGDDALGDTYIVPNFIPAVWDIV
jgi:hypothetical protein